MCGNSIAYYSRIRIINVRESIITFFFSKNKEGNLDAIVVNMLRSMTTFVWCSIEMITLNLKQRSMKLMDDDFHSYQCYNNKKLLLSLLFRCGIADKYIHNSFVRSISIYKKKNINITPFFQTIFILMLVCGPFITTQKKFN